MSSLGGATIQAVENVRSEKIEVGYVVTVLEEEHVYGTGEVLQIVGRAGEAGKGRIHFARVLWENASGWEWLNVDELTNINLSARDRTLYGGEAA